MTLTLNKPVIGSTGWGVPVNQNWEALEGAVNGKAATNLSNLDATGQAILNAKANTDASNFTATGKETVVGWGTPNYYGGFGIGSGYVAPCAGLVFIAPYRNRSQNYGYVNDWLFFRQLQTTGDADSASGTTIVSKGDTITFSGSIELCIFYPFKGVS